LYWTIIEVAMVQAVDESR